MSRQGQDLIIVDKPVPLWAGLVVILVGFSIYLPIGVPDAPRIGFGPSVLAPLICILFASIYGRSVATMLVILAPLLCIRLYFGGSGSPVSLVTGLPLSIFVATYFLVLLVSRHAKDIRGPLEPNFDSVRLGALAALLSIGAAFHLRTGTGFALDLSMTPQWTGALILFWITVSRPMRLYSFARLLASFTLLSLIIALGLIGLQSAGADYFGGATGFALSIDSSLSFSWLSAPAGADGLVYADVAWAGGLSGLFAGVSGGAAGYLLYPILAERSLTGRGGRDRWIALGVMLLGSSLIVMNPPILGTPARQLDLAMQWTLPMGHSSFQPIWWIFAVAAGVFTVARNRLYLAPAAIAIFAILGVSFALQSGSYLDFDDDFGAIFLTGALLMLTSLVYGAALWLWLMARSERLDGYAKGYIGPHETWMWSILLSLMWLAFGIDLYLTDIINLSLQLFWFAPLLAGYLAMTHGPGVIKPLIWMGIIFVPIVVLIPADTMEIEIGLGPGIWLACIAAAWACSRTDQQRAALGIKVQKPAEMAGLVLVLCLASSVLGGRLGEAYGESNWNLWLLGDHTIMAIVFVVVLSGRISALRAGIASIAAITIGILASIGLQMTEFSPAWEYDGDWAGLEMALGFGPTLYLLPALIGIVMGTWACRIALGWTAPKLGLVPILAITAALIVAAGFAIEPLDIAGDLLRDTLTASAPAADGAAQLATIDTIIVTGSRLRDYAPPYDAVREPVYILLGLAAGLGLSRRIAQRVSTIALFLIFGEAAAHNIDLIADDFEEFLFLSVGLIQSYLYFWIANWIGQRMSDPRSHQSSALEATP